MAKSTRIALLGVQHYHAGFWARAFDDCETASIVGVWDARADLAEAFAVERGLRHVDDLQSLLGEANAVAICSTTAEHGPLIKAAADAGLAILCEKPLAISAAEGMSIANYLKATGATFMQSFPKRFDPATHAVKQIVDGNRLGRLTMVRVRHGHSHGLDPEFGKAWFADPAQSGGGTLIDEGIHAADFLRYAFGEPQSVQASISSSALGLPVEDTAIATFEYPDGLIAEIATGWCFAAADASIEIYGTEGTLLLSGVDIASRPKREEAFLQVFTDGAWQALPLVPHFKTGVFHEHVAWAFADALANDRPMPTSVQDGLNAFAMIAAAYTAARQGRRMPIEYPAPVA